MRNIQLTGVYDLIICAYNSLQHIESESDVKKFLLGCQQHLSSSGIFLLDIFNPISDFLTEQPITEFKCSFSSQAFKGNKIELYETHRYDANTHINHLKYTYIDTVTKQKWENEYSMTQYDPDSMECLIESVGLHIRGKYGGYNFQPFTSDSSKQIFILEKLKNN